MSTETNKSAESAGLPSPGADGTAAAAPPGAGRALLAVLCLAQFMLILDVAVVAVAMPTIQLDLGIGAADIMWVGTAYALTFGGFLVTAGRFADLFGARRMLLVGLVVFALGSLGCGVADSGLVLFLSRGVQGLGAAMVSPAALAMVMVSFGEGAGKAKALAAWGAVSSGSAVVGQLLGGILTELASWRLIFLINLPFALLVIVAVLRQVSDQRERQSGKTDLVGASLLTAGMVLLVTAASQAGNGGFRPVVLLTGLAGLVLLAVFWFVERRVSQPMVPLGLFRNRHVSLGNVICFASAGATMAVVFFAALVMQQVLGASSLQAGLTFAPVSALITVAALKSGAAVAKFGVKNVLLIAAACSAVGIVLLSMTPADGNYLLHIVPGLVIFGIGGGLGFAPAMFVATTGVPPTEQGLASGLLSTSQQIGGVLSLALLNVVVVRVAAGGVDGSAEALMSGYRAGFLTALILPVLVAVCVLALPKGAIAPPPMMMMGPPPKED
ncbi:MFS transporter [Micromonospora echinofusca]|uniref:MFS transporter n=1 Tax=Micromonospora echinofusca TaxID=47858 RepID=A0ABS3VN12_MICEH|nr:MFS transporter [Micromonospora echinofusca]MBO4205930.1 MFS transporter [Micromonospora echinofusca]